MRGDVHKALKQHQAMTGLYFEAKDQANHILPLVIQLGAEVFFQSCQMTMAMDHQETQHCLCLFFLSVLSLSCIHQVKYHHLL